VDSRDVGFYQSVDFLALKPITKAAYRSRLESFRAKHGDKRIALMGRSHVMNLLAEKAGKLGAQRNFLKVLKLLMAFAVESGMRIDNPTAGIKLGTSKSDGHHTCTEAEIVMFEARHAIGTRARLALALLLYTAQRRADVVRMGRQHIRDGMLHVTQSKTGVSLAIPVHSNLAAIIAATLNEHLTFLCTRYGGQFTPPAFGDWFRGECRLAGLPHNCSAHGLRKAACRRLAEAGCSANVIASISGHKTLISPRAALPVPHQFRLVRLRVEATRDTATAVLSIKSETAPHLRHWLRRSELRPDGGVDGEGRSRAIRIAGACSNVAVRS
jgi:integrase